jgi:hypothetical protein
MCVIIILFCLLICMKVHACSNVLIYIVFNFIYSSLSNISLVLLVIAIAINVMKLPVRYVYPRMKAVPLPEASSCYIL